MEGFTLDGIWLVSLVAAAGTGWIVGKTGEALLALVPSRAVAWDRGSERRHEPSRSADQKVSESESVDRGRRLDAPKAPRPAAPLLAASSLDEPWSGSRRTNKADQNEMTLETLNFDDVDWDPISSVELIRKHADDIRRAENIWRIPGISKNARRIAQRKDADPIDVLDDYRAAIEGLERLGEPPGRPETTNRPIREEPLALSIGSQNLPDISAIERELSRRWHLAE